LIIVLNENLIFHFRAYFIKRNIEVSIRSKITIVLHNPEDKPTLSESQFQIDIVLYIKDNKEKAVKEVPK